MSDLNLNLVKYLVVHCSATPPSLDWGVKEINSLHRQMGYEEIGYHIVIRRKPNLLSGLIEYGTRNLNEVGAHVYGYNTESIGICMVGGITPNRKPENNFTEDQFNSLIIVLNFLKGVFPKAEILGHRDFPNVHKDCPCFDVKKWWNENFK
jgi:N-acetylmuramoyl-L-alanine amidase